MAALITWVHNIQRTLQHQLKKKKKAATLQKCTKEASFGKASCCVVSGLSSAYLQMDAARVQNCISRYAQSDQFSCPRVTVCHVAV
jgi:fatty acid/phospholipid biosynthesis enzyme